MKHNQKTKYLKTTIFTVVGVLFLIGVFAVSHMTIDPSKSTDTIVANLILPKLNVLTRFLQAEPPTEEHKMDGDPKMKECFSNSQKRQEEMYTGFNTYGSGPNAWKTRKIQEVYSSVKNATQQLEMELCMLRQFMGWKAGEYGTTTKAMNMGFAGGNINVTMVSKNVTDTAVLNRYDATEGTLSEVTVDMAPAGGTPNTSDPMFRLVFGGEGSKTYGLAIHKDKGEMGQSGSMGGCSNNQAIEFRRTANPQVARIKESFSCGGFLSASGYNASTVGSMGFTSSTYTRDVKAEYYTAASGNYSEGGFKIQYTNLSTMGGGSTVYGEQVLIDSRDGKTARVFSSDTSGGTGFTGYSSNTSKTLPSDNFEVQIVDGKVQPTTLTLINTAVVTQYQNDTNYRFHASPKDVYDSSGNAFAGTAGTVNMGSTTTPPNPTAYFNDGRAW